MRQAMLYLVYGSLGGLLGLMIALAAVQILCDIADFLVRLFT